MSQAITNSGSFKVTGNDDGKEHEARHSREEEYRKYKKYDDFEEGVILLHGDPEKHTRQQALEKAHEQGLLSEEEWQEKNEKKRPSRRQDSYQEYLESTSKSLKNQLEKNLKTGGKNKEQSRHQLVALNYNQGLAIHGNLYYLGDVENYKEDFNKNFKLMTKEDIKKYREFEVETFKEFFNSDTYQALHKDTQVRAEIHTDEAGAIHLQTSDVYFKANSRGRVQVSKNSIREENLKNVLGDDFEDYLKREKYVEDREQFYGSGFTRRDVEGLHPGLYKDVEIPKKEKGKYINRLFRRVESDALEDIALERSRSMGVDWEREYNVSDGEYLNKERYKQQARDKELLEIEQKQLDSQRYNQKKLEEKQKEREEELESREKRMDQKERELEQKQRQGVKELYLDQITELNPDLTYLEFMKDRYDIPKNEPYEPTPQERNAMRQDGCEVGDEREPISSERGRRPFKIWGTDVIKEYADELMERVVVTKVREVVQRAWDKNEALFNKRNMEQEAHSLVNRQRAKNAQKRPSKGFEFEP